jgi:hypothetical protein
VNGLEHFVILHADGDKLADVEEAAPIDFVIRGPPPSQTIVLLFEQPVQARASGASSASARRLLFLPLRLVFPIGWIGGR